uniref:Uncharacterized protein n=1 Tax=Nelumbo nucifera TaxID=4432 RepID=A0A822YBH5_NELNU|nr:TPA_asm: hypothetical protein HUJ06_031140 [Nelumbo nucifera]
MLRIAEVKDDVMGQFHNVLYLGDVKERVKILENAGHLPPAYVIVASHGLQDVAERLAAELGDNIPTLPEGRVPSLVMPPSPILCGGDWPLLRVMKGIIKSELDNVGRGAEEDDEETTDGDWGEDLDIIDANGMQNGDIAVVVDDGEGEEERPGEREREREGEREMLRNLR